MILGRRVRTHSDMRGLLWPKTDPKVGITPPRWMGMRRAVTAERVRLGRWRPEGIQKRLLEALVREREGLRRESHRSQALMSLAAGPTAVILIDSLQFIDCG